MVHDNFGSGFALMLQKRVTFSPSVLVPFCGWVVISGVTTINKIKLYAIILQNLGRYTQLQ